MQDDLITFGQLLQIKREKLGLSLSEAATRSNISNISYMEKDKVKPTKKTMLKLMAFYKITEQEIANCKKTAKQPAEKQQSKRRLPMILDMLEHVIKDVEGIKEKGSLAAKIKDEALTALNDAFRLVNNVIVIDRVI